MSAGARQMRAAMVVPHPGGGSVEVRDVERPALTPGGVLVRVKASGINRGEILLRRATRQGTPAIGGIEFAGEVAAVADGVKSFQVGDRVMGHGSGGQAEYIVSDPRRLMPVPKHMSWAEAAAFPNVFTTAHDAVITNGGLVAGESVLVNASSSGIGTAAIQIAKAFGAKTIIGVSRHRAKLDKIMSLGLTHAVATSDEPLEPAVKKATADRGVDLVIDILGGSVIAETMRVMAVRGRLVNIGRLGAKSGEIDMDRLSFQRLKLIGASFRTRTRDETVACIEACGRDLLPMLVAGKLVVPVDRCYPVEEIAAAHDYVETNAHVGKVVLTFN